MIVMTGASGGLGEYIKNKLDDVTPIYNSHVIDGVKVDITVEDEIREFVRKREWHNIVLINMAAISINGWAARYVNSAWQETMDVNVRGAFLLAKAFLPIMVKQKWGRIINISSILGRHGIPGTIAYSASKAALNGMSKVLSREYGCDGVTSNVIELGYFDRGLIKTVPQDYQEGLLEAIPSGKFGHPDNIVNCIKFLIDSEYVNGAIITIDGGLT